jgi:ATP-dependent helicase HrpB
VALSPLPIDALQADIAAALRTRSALVLEAPPGAGKTTRVPPALLDGGLAGSREVIVLEPRRLATRLAAARVAHERGERVGETVGYQIRFEDVSGPKTRLRFVTEGVLTRRLVADPHLERVGLVVLDEFHERHLAGDLALAMLRRLQQDARPDLKLVVMSATLEAEPIAAWLGQAPRLRSEGRCFDVGLEHLPQEDERPLETQVLGALKRLVQAQLDGHVLVFLPGAAEIRRTHEACVEFAQRHELALLALHGDLPAAEQDRVLAPSTQRKVILATNVAETSVTIDGVAAVIDSGLARVASHSPWSGLSTLRVAKVSKASATQRAGRAGRTRAGVCLRLFTRADYESRLPADSPEIRRLDFTESALALRAMGVRDLAGFPFFEAPPASSLDAADTLLRRLGALTPDGALSELGRRLLRFPVHPRLARLIVEAERRGVAEDGVALAALVGERDIRLEARASLRGGREARRAVSGPSDLLELLERFREGVRFGAKRAGLDAGTLSSVERLQKQLLRLADRRSAAAPGSESQRDEALLQAVLASAPDRVAKRRRPQAPELVLAGGGSATLDASSVVHDAELLVAVDAEERRGAVCVRLASRIEPEWLLEFAPHEIGELDTLAWNASSERVERLTRLTFGGVVLEETRRPAVASPEATALLADAAALAGPAAFLEPDRLSHWACRVEALRQAFPEAGLPLVDRAWIEAALREACAGLRSFSELRGLALIELWRSKLTAVQLRLLQAEAPERITLPSGRVIQVHYEPGKPPWVESRLQDFFGSLKGPSLGRAPLVLHLLAPNQRAVQVTTDLAGFWDRHYPSIRRELMRHYPRHAWPEDPRTAAPPPPKPPRR